MKLRKTIKTILKETISEKLKDYIDSKYLGQSFKFTITDEEIAFRVDSIVYNEEDDNLMIYVELINGKTPSRWKAKMIEQFLGDKLEYIGFDFYSVYVDITDSVLSESVEESEIERIKKYLLNGKMRPFNGHYHEIKSLGFANTHRSSGLNYDLINGQCKIKKVEYDEGIFYIDMTHYADAVRIQETFSDDTESVTTVVPIEEFVGKMNSTMSWGTALSNMIREGSYRFAKELSELLGMDDNSIQLWDSYLHRHP
jgi:hypothetical protein